MPTVMPAIQPMGKLIGEQLLRKELINAEQLRIAMDKQKLSGRPIGEILVADGVLTEAQVVEALSEQLQVPFIDVESYEVEHAILALFPQKFLREHLALPLFRVNNTITVAMADPLDVRTIDRLRFLVGCEIEPVFGTTGAITKMLDRCYGATAPLDEIIQEVKLGGSRVVPKTPPQPQGPSAASPTSAAAPHAAAGTMKPAEGGLSEAIAAASSERVEGLVAAAEKAPIVKLVDTILKQGVENRASDIHLEPEEQDRKSVV